MHFEYGEDIGVKGDRIFWGDEERTLKPFRAGVRVKISICGPKLTHHLVFFVVVVNSF